MASKKDEPTFEGLYQRLEDTVARLEKGDLTLEESVSLYEEGMKLARACQEMLQQAELRVTKLQESFTEGLSAFREDGEDYPADYEPEAAQEELPAE